MTDNNTNNARIRLGDEITGEKNAKRIKALRRLANDFEKTIEEIEDAGMEDGRFFVHLRAGWDFNIDPWEVRSIQSFGSTAEARHGMSKVTLAHTGKRS